MRTLIRFVGGGIVGAAIGAGAVMLLAPQSGKELQSRIAARRQEAIDAGKAEAASRERQLRADWEARIDAEAIQRRALQGREV